VCVRKKKNNKRDDVREEEIEREKSCFLGYLFASFASFPLSSLSLYFFESHTTRKKRTPLSVSVLFRFYATTTRTLSVLLLLHSRAHTKRQNNENTLYKERRWL